MFKEITLSREKWIGIVRHLTSAVGSDDQTRKWAESIKEQLNGSVSIKLSKKSVSAKARNGGDLRNVIF